MAVYDKQRPRLASYLKSYSITKPFSQIEKEKINMPIVRLIVFLSCLVMFHSMCHAENMIQNPHTWCSKHIVPHTMKTHTGPKQSVFEWFACETWVTSVFEINNELHTQTEIYMYESYICTQRDVNTSYLLYRERCIYFLFICSERDVYTYYLLYRERCIYIYIYIHINVCYLHYKDMSGYSTRAISIICASPPPSLSRYPHNHHR